MRLPVHMVKLKLLVQTQRPNKDTESGSRVGKLMRNTEILSKPSEMKLGKLKPKCN